MNFEETQQNYIAVKFDANQLERLLIDYEQNSKFSKRTTLLFNYVTEIKRKTKTNRLTFVL